jgi:hypothetical protein
MRLTQQEILTCFSLRTSPWTLRNSIYSISLMCGPHGPNVLPCLCNGISCVLMWATIKFCWSQLTFKLKIVLVQERWQNSYHISFFQNLLWTCSPSPIYRSFPLALQKFSISCSRENTRISLVVSPWNLLGRLAAQSPWHLAGESKERWWY